MKSLPSLSNILTTSRLPLLLLALGNPASGACQYVPRAVPVESPQAHQAVADFDADRAWQHLTKLVAIGERPSGTPQNAATQDYIATSLEQLGLDPIRESFRADTPVGRLPYTNIFVDLAPTDGTPIGTAPIVVLCTHFDTKLLPFEFVGANDGGSGTAVLLELARCLIQRPARTVTYRLLFLDGEEAVRSYWADEDNCYGSRYHVRQLRRTHTLRRVKACVLLDMVGDADLQFSREGFSDPRLLRLFESAARRLKLGQHMGGTARDVKDDHLRFIEAGIPSVDLIDFEYGVGNAHWHHTSDRLELCSAASLGITGRIVLEGLTDLESFAHHTPAEPK